jgi:hypothetical protein
MPAPILRKYWVPACRPRPLVYLFIDGLVPLTNEWGGSWANVRAAFNELRMAAIGAGLGSFYVVIMNGNPINAASYAVQTDADAISNYRGGTPGVAMP